MKTPKELGITSKQFNNLLKLANFLNNKKNLPKEVEFNMQTYCEASNTFQSKCGAVGCAVGFAPFTGIRKIKEESWKEYAERVLIGDDYSEEIYDWLFSSFWANIDNTPKGAAKRIFWFLKNNVPENLYEQRDGRDPLCYNTNHLKK